jgi:hypothetical protein
MAPLCPLLQPVCLLLTVFVNVASKHSVSSIATVMLAYQRFLARMYLDIIRVYDFEHLTLT